MISKALLMPFALLLVLLFLSDVGEARPSCESCLASGYPYFCKASITSHICFTKAGDAQCDHLTCVCCKAELLGGCRVCEEADEDEGEEVLEQTDNWQSHEVRKKMEDELKQFHSERDRELAIERERVAKAKEEEDKNNAQKGKESDDVNDEMSAPSSVSPSSSILNEEAIPEEANNKSEEL